MLYAIAYTIKMSKMGSHKIDGYFDYVVPPLDEGLCVQIMHHGPFDDEPASVALMNDFIAQNGYENDITDKRLHHEIYMSDARKLAPEKWKTVIRHPIKKK